MQDLESVGSEGQTDGTKRNSLNEKNTPVIAGPTAP